MNCGSGMAYLDDRVPNKREGVSLFAIDFIRFLTMSTASPILWFAMGGYLEIFDLFHLRIHLTFSPNPTIKTSLFFLKFFPCTTYFVKMSGFLHYTKARANFFDN